MKFMEKYNGKGAIIDIFSTYLSLQPYAWCTTANFLTSFILIKK